MRCDDCGKIIDFCRCDTDMLSHFERFLGLTGKGLIFMEQIIRGKLRPLLKVGYKIFEPDNLYLANTGLDLVIEYHIPFLPALGIPLNFVEIVDKRGQVWFRRDASFFWAEGDEIHIKWSWGNGNGCERPYSFNLYPRKKGGSFEDPLGMNNFR